MKKFFAILSLLLLFPVVVFATCNSSGYTVVYVNGINTTERMAAEDNETFSLAFSKYSDLKNVSFFNAYNQARGQDTDLNEAAAQLVFSRENVFDAIDFRYILQQIQSHLDTQKVLLVGHSQGTLYANEVYDYLIKHGVSKDSIAIYNIATPADHVSGQPDKTKDYLTSSTDKVINKIRDEATSARNNHTAISTYEVAKSAAAAFVYPLTANITIQPDAIQTVDPNGGHSFVDVYLARAGDRIVADMEKELVALKDDGTIHTGTCFEVSENSFSYLAARSVSTMVSFTASVANALKNTASALLSGVSQIASDVIGGTNGLAHSAEPEYESTNFNVANHIFGAGNQQVDGENLYDLLRDGNPSQGGAVILATVDDADESAPEVAQTPAEPNAPTVPIGPAPGFSPGGGGGGSSGAVNAATVQTTAASVPDTTAPVIDGTPTDFSIQAASYSATDAVGTYTTPTATDDVDGSVAVSCSPVSGSTFAVGTTSVTCSTIDAAGNTASTTFSIGVYVPVPPPVAVPVVINEVAWGGGFGSPDDQWVELYNNGSDSVSLDDIVLTSSDGSLHMPLSGTIAGNGFYVLLANDEAIRNIKNNWSNYIANASLVLGSTPKQLQLVRVGAGGTTTLDQTPAEGACGGAWCAGSAGATDGYAAPTGNPFPITMERVSAGSSGESSGNWASSDGYLYVANDRNQQRIIGTPNYANTSHWPMVGFVCTGDSSVLTPGSTYTHRPASNNCHYLYGSSSYNWSVEAVLLKGIIGSSTIVTQLSASNGPYKDLQTDASHYYDFANANTGDTFAVVLYEFSNANIGFNNAIYVSDMRHYLETGFQRDGTTASAPYTYQTISFVIP